MWDRTRGQTRGADSLSTYHERLVRAVEAGLITADEARQAWQRAASGGRYPRYSVTAGNTVTPVTAPHGREEGA